MVDVEAAGARELRGGRRAAVPGVAARARARDDDLALAVDPVDALRGGDVETSQVVVHEPDDRVGEAGHEHCALLRAQVDLDDALEIPVADHERAVRSERERAGRRDPDRLRLGLRLRTGFDAGGADHTEREQDEGELPHAASIHR